MSAHTLDYRNLRFPTGKPGPRDARMSNPLLLLSRLKMQRSIAQRDGDRDAMRYYARMMTILIAIWHKQEAGAR